ncbi:unnamed protein product [Dicrocoelium dendriticum]|nr:unnamed protein product [Dicrocoelium dendriticum]
MECSASEYSLVLPYGSHSSDECGYCKGTNEGLHTTWERLTVSDYQYLIDRGWRRSGTYCYKPLNEVTCCPCYTIRCDALAFRPSRSHKRVIRNVATFLKTGRYNFVKTSTRYPGPSNSPYQRGSSLLLTAGGDIPSIPPKNARCLLPEDSRNILAQQISAAGDRPIEPSVASNACSSPVQLLSGPHRGGSVVVLPSRQAKSSKSRIRRWNAKLLRMKEKAEREKRSVEEIFEEYNKRRQMRLRKNRPKELEDLLQCIPTKEGACHTIEIRLVRSQPPSAAFQRTIELEHLVYQEYQMKVHHDEPSKCDMKSFTRFLVNSPLVLDSEQESGVTSDAAPQFGSYHQQYWLDDEKLIAVGVVDLLPKCLSSVYLFYDPDYSFLQLGTYSALREIAFVREIARQFGPTSLSPDSRYADFTSYYMGYFIRSCPKMSYKAKFQPSYLACPETYTWVPLQQCLVLLNSYSNGKYCRFSPPSETDQFAIDTLIGNDPSSVDQHILCHIRYEANRKRKSQYAPKDDLCSLSPAIQLDRLKSNLNPNYVNTLREWAVLVGKRAVDGHIRVKFD